MVRDHSSVISITKQETEKNIIPFAPEGDDNPLRASLIHLLVDLAAKGNGAHDTISEFLVEYRLEGITIVLHNFVQPIDQRLDWGHGAGSTAVREAHHLGGDFLLGDTEQPG